MIWYGNRDAWKLLVRNGDDITNYEDETFIVYSNWKTNIRDYWLFYIDFFKYFIFSTFNLLYNISYSFEQNKSCYFLVPFNKKNGQVNKSEEINIFLPVLYSCKVASTVWNHDSGEFRQFLHIHSVGSVNLEHRFLQTLVWHFAQVTTRSPSKMPLMDRRYAPHTSQYQSRRLLRFLQKIKSIKFLIFHDFETIVCLLLMASIRSITNILAFLKKFIVLYLILCWNFISKIRTTQWPLKIYEKLKVPIIRDTRDWWTSSIRRDATVQLCC